MSRRARLLLFALLSLAGCAWRRDDPDPRSHGPTYDAAAIYRLELEGVHLGMAQGEACARLVARGFRRQGRGDCGPHDDLRADDGFIDQAEDVESTPHAGPGAAPETMWHVHLRYEAVAGRQVVIKIGAYSRAPGQPEALTRATIAAWGLPTFHGHYAADYVQMVWAASPRQANPNHRERFGRCTYRPQCEWQRGTDCGPIFREFATPVAQAVIYNWGRYLSIEDEGAFLRELRRSGDLYRRPWQRPGNGCQPVSVH